MVKYRRCSTRYRIIKSTFIKKYEEEFNLLKIAEFEKLFDKIGTVLK